MAPPVIFRVDATPSPSSRPRVGKFGTYYAKSYAEYLADGTKQLAIQVSRSGTVQGELAAIVETIVERPKTTKRSSPKGDVDNYAKAPLDAATKANVYGDDGEIIELSTWKRFAESGEKPGFVLHVGELKPWN